MRGSFATRQRPFVVALTGGIAAGKSLVSDEFKSLGADVIDTDEIAHRVTEPGQPAIESIVLAFGRDVLLPNGRLDRKNLRNLIFSSPRARKTLESILHPIIWDAVKKKRGELKGAYCLLVIPLLAETGTPEFVDRVLVVDAPDALRIQRLMARDGVSHAQAQATLAAQADRETRLAIADDVIENSDDKSLVRESVHQLHEIYLLAERERQKN